MTLGTHPPTGRVSHHLPVPRTSRQPGIAHKVVSEASGMMGSEKIALEFKIPPTGKPVEAGYFLYLSSIGLEGGVAQHGNVHITGKGDQLKNQIKLAVQTKWHDWDQNFAFTADTATLQSISDEIQKGSLAGVAKAILKPFETSVKKSFPIFGPLSIAPEFGTKFSETFITFGVAYQWEETLPVGGTPLKCKFAVKLGWNVGLSKQGWTWVAKKVGGETLKRFATSAGRSLAGMWEYLAAEGILTAAGIVLGAAAMTYAGVYLMAWAVSNEKEKGKHQQLANCYAGSYVWTVFQRGRFREVVFPENQKAGEDLKDAAEKDALNDARENLRKAGRKEADGTAEQALAAYRGMLLEQAGGVYFTAYERLHRAIEQRARQASGVKD